MAANHIKIGIAENLYLRGIKGVVFLIPFLPLYVTNSMLFPYITGKNFVFRILVEFAAALWLCLIYIKKEYRLRNSAITLSILTFTFIVGLADLMGVDPYNSFWSNYERMEGYITILHLALYFLILKSVLSSKRDWKIFFNISVAVSILVSIYALIAPLPAHNSTQFAIVYGQRIYGTIGNPPFLASYLLLSVFIALILSFKTQRLHFKFAYLLPVVINSIAIYFTASRGAILALIIGAIMFILSYLFGKTNSPREKFIKKAVLSIIVALIISSVVFLASRNADFIKHDRTLSRFATMFSDASVQNRFIAWQYAWEGIKERPVLGWGQENFIGVYTVSPIPLVSEQIWFDRAHNIVIDWLVNAGILGLFSYLTIFGTAFYVLWTAFQKKRVSKNEALTIGTALAVYFIHNLFTFDTINSYLLFFALLAYMDHTNEATDLEESADLNKIKIKSVYVILPALLLFSIVFYYVNYKPLKESRFIQIKISFSKDNSYLDILNDFNNALSLKTFGDDHVRQAMSSMSFFIIGSNRFRQKGALEFIEKTVEELEKGISRNRFDLEYLTNVIFLYQQIARSESSLPSFLDHTESLIRACINLNPLYERLYFMLADTLARKKDYDNAMEIAGNIATQDPVNDIKYFELALIAILSSKDDVVSSAFEKVEAIRMTKYDYSTADKDIIFSVGELRRLAQIYIDSNRFYEAIHSYQQVIASLQDNDRSAARIHYKIANIFHIVGNSNNAVKEIKKAAELDPENFSVKAEEFINSLNN